MMDFLILLVFFIITEAIFFPTFYNALLMLLGKSYTLPALLNWKSVFMGSEYGLMVFVSFNAALLAFYLSFKLKHSGLNVDDSVNESAYGSARFRSIKELQTQYPYYYSEKHQGDHKGLYTIYMRVKSVFAKKK